jgi:hypothetical protein
MFFSGLFLILKRQLSGGRPKSDWKIISSEQAHEYTKIEKAMERLFAA